MSEKRIPPSGDPFYAAGRRTDPDEDQREERGLSLRALARAIVGDQTSETCERCGAVADLETLDGVHLCEGCSVDTSSEA